MLKAAIGAGYEIVPLERFLDEAAQIDDRPVLILRHDVDQHPASALTMSEVEASLGLHSSWYFRWRTSNPDVIAALRRRGGEIGFHYETLTRQALEDGEAEGDERAPGIDQARARLREEVATFQDLFGPIRSVSAHGDTRVAGVSNGALLRGQDLRGYGVDYDANESMRRHRLAAWLTDRSAAEGGWGGGVDPFALIRERRTPILCLTHPNNWVSGPALWRDRLLSRTIGRPEPGSRTRIPRTGSDRPPPGERGEARAASASRAG